MSFEYLVWDGVIGEKRGSSAAVLGVALASLGWLLASRPVLSALALGAVCVVVLVTSRHRMRLRSARDRLLFALGFSSEQLATLLVLEGALSGAFGAALASGVALLARSDIAGLHLPVLADVSLVASSEALSKMFVSVLLFSALGALVPARALALSELGGAAIHDDLAAGDE